MTLAKNMLPERFWFINFIYKEKWGTIITQRKIKNAVNKIELVKKI